MIPDEHVGRPVPHYECELIAVPRVREEQQRIKRHVQAGEVGIRAKARLSSMIRSAGQMSPRPYSPSTPLLSRRRSARARGTAWPNDAPASVDRCLRSSALAGASSASGSPSALGDGFGEGKLHAALVGRLERLLNERATGMPLALLVVADQGLERRRGRAHDLPDLLCGPKQRAARRGLCSLAAIQARSLGTRRSLAVRPIAV